MHVTELQLAVALGGAAVVLSLFYLFRRFFVSKGHDLQVPGLSPSSPEGGNFDDIAKAGSLHEFLVGLHKKFGPIASFWWGPQHTVSIASPELFKQHQDLFDRPPELFRMFEPFVTPHSIQFANGKDGRSRREDYDKVFNYDLMGIYYKDIQQVADEIVGKWKMLSPDDHLPLGQHMFLFAVKVALVALLGDKFKDDKEALAFRDCYEVVWEDMEKSLTEPGSFSEERQQAFDNAMGTLRRIVRHAVSEREVHGDEARDFLLIDAIIGHHKDEETRFADAITYTVGGFHTGGNLLTWALYFMCKHEDVQEKLYNEVISVLGSDGKLEHKILGKLKYMRQVLDESLRRGVVAPWGARFSDQDFELAGYHIPAKVPVIHALGVSLINDKVWKEPMRFNPDRFSPEGSKGRPTIAFSPFGFAGKRQCPGYRFAYVEASIMLATALQSYKFQLVPGQEVHMQHGLVTHPREEIWVKLVKRN